MSLQQIQEKLKAPKSQYNKFGKYNYRNQEDILEALKPMLAEYGYTLLITDEIVEVGGRVYVKATPRLYDDGEKPPIAETCGYAREPEDRKGMDASQITGASSSYARKYALNGMFLIDDTKDADSMEPEKPKAKPAPKKAAVIEDSDEKATLDQVKLFWLQMREAGVESDDGRVSVKRHLRLPTMKDCAATRMGNILDNWDAFLKQLRDKEVI